MIVIDKSIHEWALSGGVSPYTPEMVNPASLDLRWSGLFRETFDGNFRYTVGRSSGAWTKAEEAKTMLLHPGKLYMLDTLETVIIPDDWAGLLELKSSVARLGITLLNNGYFDPGYKGTATIILENRAPWMIEINKNTRLVQMILYICTNKPDKTYQETGRYINVQEPQLAIKEK